MKVRPGRTAQAGRPVHGVGSEPLAVFLHCARRLPFVLPMKTRNARRRSGLGWVGFAGLLGVLPPASAQGVLEAPADVAWVVAASALVFFMQAGFALLEGGQARAKNAVNVIMKNYADMSFGVLAFWAVGFGLMFGSS